jgi:ADP-ribose pyrophosphatase YjhB (NUDIX family)
MMDNKIDFLEYERPSVTTDIVLLRTVDTELNNRKNTGKELQVRLYKRKDTPFNDKWSLPGGFVGIDKTIEEVALKKVEEKTGYTNFYLEQLYTFDKPDRDNRWRVISVAHIGIVNNNSVLTNNSSFVSEWFTINNDTLYNKNLNLTLKFSDLAFDHQEIINMTIQRIQNKIFYTDIGFNFLEDTFTLRDLQNVFETILGHNIDNFRRTMKDRVTPTKKSIQGKAHRPAELYQKKE